MKVKRLKNGLYVLACPDCGQEMSAASLRALAYYLWQHVVHAHESELTRAEVAALVDRKV